MSETSNSEEIKPVVENKIPVSVDNQSKATSEELQSANTSVQKRQRRQFKDESAVSAVSKATSTYDVLKGKALLFGKYSTSDIIVGDESVRNYVRFNGQVFPNMYGRRKYHAYYHSHLDIIERLVNKMMRGGTGKKVGGKVIRTEGRLQGKKLKVMRIVEQAFENINKKTGKNPVQIFVDALQNAAPIEDTTRVRYGGISYNVAVGISSNRRVDVALRNIALAALINAFNKKKKLADALSDELVLAADKSPDSYAIKKRLEGERIAKRAR